MQLIPVRVLGRLGVLTAVWWLAVSIWPGTAWANPYINRAIYIHVQPADPEFCTHCPIQNCEQIVMTSPLTDTLDFDLFFVPTGYWTPDYLELLEFSCEWPAEWGFVGVEACVGELTFEQQGHQLTASVDIPTWRHPGVPDPPTTEDFFPVLRVTLDVTTTGRFNCPASRVWTYLGGEPGMHPYPVAYAWARAGHPCGNCGWVCVGGPQCDPDPDSWLQFPLVVAMEVAPGEMVTVNRVVELGTQSCPAAFEPTADWLSVSAAPLPYGGYEPVLTADASALAPGVYEAWVHVITEHCMECLQVLLTVREDTPTQQVSWGRIKSRFR